MTIINTTQSVPDHTLSISAGFLLARSLAPTRLSGEWILTGAATFPAALALAASIARSRSLPPGARGQGTGNRGSMDSTHRRRGIRSSALTHGRMHFHGTTHTLQHSSHTLTLTLTSTTLLLWITHTHTHSHSHGLGELATQLAADASPANPLPQLAMPWSSHHSSVSPSLYIASSLPPRHLPRPRLPLLVQGHSVPGHFNSTSHRPPSVTPVVTPRDGLTIVDLFASRRLYRMFVSPSPLLLLVVVCAAFRPSIV
ncbi:hypothetical protein G7046_g9406 [Stylonectria norvegica]|nr:hypothetical protein G7046_g9406 [Stylonectria norvegica]